MSKDPAGNDDTTSDELDFAASTDQKYNKLVLVGEPDWVKGMIYKLHVRQVVEASCWGRSQPTKNSGEVITTWMRRRKEE